MGNLVVVIFIIYSIPAWAGMIGDSHNMTDAVGRNRANVIYTPAKVATQTQIKPAIVTDNVTEIAEIITPVPAPIPVAEPDLTTDIADATEYLARLQSEINKIDSEIARCNRAKRNWTIGTVIGGAGVVSTATGAIVQSIQISKAKKQGATLADTPEQQGDAQ